MPKPCPLSCNMVYRWPQTPLVSLYGQRIRIHSLKDARALSRRLPNGYYISAEIANSRIATVKGLEPSRLPAQESKSCVSIQFHHTADKFIFFLFFIRIEINWDVKIRTCYFTASAWRRPKNNFKKKKYSGIRINFFCLSRTFFFS